MFNCADPEEDEPMASLITVTHLPSGPPIARSELLVQYVHGCTLSCAPAFSVQHCCLHASHWTLRYRHGKLLDMCL